MKPLPLLLVLALTACSPSAHEPPASQNEPTTEQSAAVDPVEESAAPEKSSKLPDSVIAALNEALDDERRVRAFYEAVMQVHGERRPFSNIIHAEVRHSDALLAIYDRYAITPPDDTHSPDDFEVPDSFSEACQMGVDSEIANAAMYEHLIVAAQDYPDIVATFEQLRWASQERHLPAFQRHASGAGEAPGRGMGRGNGPDG